MGQTLLLKYIKDAHREKAPSSKTPALTKSMNMDICAVGTPNQLFLGGKNVSERKVFLKKSSYWLNSPANISKSDRHCCNVENETKYDVNFLHNVDTTSDTDSTLYQRCFNVCHNYDTTNQRCFNVAPTLLKLCRNQLGY